jgi:16S rRNA (guanine527-N7)-methyltransferase
MRKILTDGLAELGLNATENALSRFETYSQFLSERNAVMNLTAITSEEDVARLHFLDCAALFKAYNFSDCSVIDVGSGAGFPGIPLKILSPGLRLTLLDSQQKRVVFMEDTCKKLGFDDVKCLWARAEQAAGDIGGSFDVAVSRAVAKLNILCELCLPFVRTGGVFVAMKGPDSAEELENARHAITVLGGGASEIKTYQIPGTGITHSAVIIKKVRPTPKYYPRQFGTIKKSPL